MTTQAGQTEHGLRTLQALDKLQTPMVANDQQLLIHGTQDNLVHLEFQGEQYLANKTVVVALKTNLAIRSKESAITDFEWQVAQDSQELLKTWLDKYSLKINPETTSNLVIEALTLKNNFSYGAQAHKLDFRVNITHAVTNVGSNIVSEVDSYELARRFLAAPETFLGVVQFSNDFPNFCGIHNAIAETFVNKPEILQNIHGLKKLITDNASLNAELLNMAKGDSLHHVYYIFGPNKKFNSLSLDISPDIAQQFLSSFPNHLRMEGGKLVFGGQCRIAAETAQVVLGFRLSSSDEVKTFVMRTFDPQSNFETRDTYLDFDSCLWPLIEAQQIPLLNCEQITSLCKSVGYSVNEIAKLS